MNQPDKTIAFVPAREPTPQSMVSTYRETLEEAFKEKGKDHGIFHVIDTADPTKHKYVSTFLYDLDESMTDRPDKYLGRSLLVYHTALDSLGTQEGTPVPVFRIWEITARRIAYVLDDKYDDQSLRDKTLNISETARLVKDATSFRDFIKRIKTDINLDNTVLMFSSASVLSNITSPADSLEQFYRDLGTATTDPTLSGSFSVLMTFPWHDPIKSLFANINPNLEGQSRSTLISTNKIQALVPHAKIIEL